MIGDPCPDFLLPSTAGGEFQPANVLGRLLVIYFYPKDNTPGCSDEARQFRDLYRGFRDRDCDILGVSRDSLKSHTSFKTKMSLPFELLSDPQEQACEAFGVMKTKMLYGRKVRGIERSTFVVGRDGAIRGEWRGVKVAGHAQAVLDFLGTLN